MRRHLAHTNIPDTYTCDDNRRLPTKRTSSATTEGGGGEGNESLAYLYGEKALRYCVVFDELVRQAAVHSEGLATLVGKVY